MRKEIFEIDDVYEGICMLEVSVMERAEQLDSRQTRFKRYLSFYERLSLYVTGKDIEAEIVRIEAEHQDKVGELMESIGLSYDTYTMDEDAALAAMREKASSDEGYDDLVSAFEELEDFSFKLDLRFDDLAAVQERIAAVAYDAERYRRGAQQPSLEDYLCHMESQWQKVQEAVESIANPVVYGTMSPPDFDPEEEWPE